MRRRPPHLIRLSPGEVTYLETLVSDGRIEQRTARRARILLAMADPDIVVSELADSLGLDRTTIWDNGPSHKAKATHDFLRSHYPHVRVLFTPAHASWLNQAELLLRAFTARYLLRGEWASRTDLIDHFDASWPEYNRLYAHPFTWS